MERLLAKDAILQTVYQLNYAEDELDKQLFFSVFVPNQKMTLDMNGYLGLPVMHLYPEELWDKAIFPAVSGFSGTQHQAGNAIVTFDDNDTSKAFVKESVIAYHCIEEGGKVESVTARAIQAFDMVLWEGQWKIQKFEIKMTCPSDNPELNAKAAERVKTGLGRAAKS